MLDPRTVVWHATRPDIGEWTIAKSVASVELAPGDQGGIKLALTPYLSRINEDRWPDRTPGGWDGTIRWTLCLAVQVAGIWHGAAFQEFWHDRVWTGAGLLTHWTAGWGDQRGMFGPELTGYRPKRGDKIALMAVAGQLRLKKEQAAGNEHMLTVRERSNMVVVELQDAAFYSFPETMFPPTPPAPPVVPVEPSLPIPHVDLGAIMVVLADMQKQLDIQGKQLQELVKREPPTYRGRLQIDRTFPWPIGRVAVDAPVTLEPGE